MTAFDGSLQSLLMLLNAAGVTEYSDGTITLKLSGDGARTFEEAVKPRRSRSKPEPEPFDDIALALNGPPPGADLGG